MTTPSYSIAQTMPAELLELVFDAVIELDKKEARARVDYQRQFYGPPARKVGISLDPIEKQFIGSSRGLLPCLTVCKLWYPIAEKALYSKIDLVIPGDTADPTAEAFLRAISDRPSLASLVQSLSIGIGHHAPAMMRSLPDDQVIRIHCKRCVEILSACVKLDHLLVFAFAMSAKRALLESIVGHAQLRTLAFGDPWTDLTSAAFAPFLLADYQAPVRTCHSLKVLGLRSAHISASSFTWHTLTSHVRHLELYDVAMSDEHFGALIEQVAPTLQALRITYEVSNGTYGSVWPSYPAICEALGLLQQLEHLHLDIQQDCVEFDHHSTSPALLSACRKLKTVYISPDTFPFTGLGHLASFQLRTIHFWVPSGAFSPPLDVDALSTGIEAMLLSPQTCPQTLSVAHQISYIDAEDFDEDLPPEYPQDDRLEDDLVKNLSTACKAAGVEFVYKVFWQ